MKQVAALVFLLAVAIPVSVHAQIPGGPTAPLIATHDNTRPAGRAQGNVLTLPLWTGMGRWYPEGPTGKERRVAAFGEEGGPLSVPSPLIHVVQGTEVRATVRNTLPSALHLHGFCNRSGSCDPVIVSAGATLDVRFTLDTAGTFHYWAATSAASLDLRLGDDSLLGGAIVVDPAGAPAQDRVFVLGLMTERSGAGTSELTVINGRSWPHTERLEYRVGETVRWRIVNLTAAAHPLHLHGFYFTVESAGDGVRDVITPATDRRSAVTERMTPGQTRTLTWTAERPGNWLFHCHMLVHHVVESLAPDHAAGADAHAADPEALGMQGLVLGIRVTGPAPAVVPDNGVRRRFQLIVSPDTRRNSPSYKVDLFAGTTAAPRVNDLAVPGPVMVLTRGEPIAVEVVNRLQEPTAIHWHGIELESQYDGVPDISGTPGSVTPPIAPGRSYTALFTPPRAGTFMYHTHWHNRDQLSAGVYGPLIVLEPGQRYDPETDHVIVLGLDGPYRLPPDEPFVVNGETKPAPLVLKAGVPNRLRFIGILADNPSLVVQLVAPFDPMQWTIVAKDGADLPSGQRPRPARQGIAVGETYDVQVAAMPPTTVGVWMELRRGNGELVFQWPVRVK